MYIPALIAMLVFAVIILMTLGTAMLMRSGEERRQVVAKMRHSESVTGVRGAGPSSQDGGFRARIITLFHTLGTVAKPKNERDISHIRTLFLRAGSKGKNPLLAFFSAKVLLAGLLLALFLVFRLIVVLHMSLTGMMAISVLLTAIGFYMPNLWLSVRIARRKEELTIGFPDALDLLVVCTEAGMGLDAALKRVGAEMELSNAVVSEEFRTLNLELRAGKTKSDALRNLALRTGLEDVNTLMTLLIQTDKFGTSIAQALRVHADSMRTRRIQKVEEIAAKLPVKLLFPTILCIFPALFLVILGPAIIQVFRMWGR